MNGPRTEFEEQHQALQMVSSKITEFVQSVLPCQQQFVQSVLPCWQHCFPDTFPLSKFFDNFFCCYQLCLTARLSLGEGGEGVWFRLQFFWVIFETIFLAEGYKTCFSFRIRAPVFSILLHGLRCVFVFLLRCGNTVQEWISYNRCGNFFCFFLWIQLIHAVAWVRCVCVCVCVRLYWKGCCYSESY